VATRPPIPCPVCAALVTDDDGHTEQHATWHANTKTLGSKHGSYGTVGGLLAGFREMRRAVELVAAAKDDRPTEKLPPIGETVRRRPPVPPSVRELKGPELLRALADELDRDGLSLDDLDDDQ
jgi:hypothetical protein